MERPGSIAIVMRHRPMLRDWRSGARLRRIFNPLGCDRNDSGKIQQNAERLEGADALLRPFSTGNRLKRKYWSFDTSSTAEPGQSVITGPAYPKNARLFAGGEEWSRSGELLR